jgi:hypothetical protein
MALSCRAAQQQPRQLSGVKRTSQLDRAAAANDPKRTWRRGDLEGRKVKSQKSAIAVVRRLEDFSSVTATDRRLWPPLATNLIANLRACQRLFSVWLT